MFSKNICKEASPMGAKMPKTQEFQGALPLDPHPQGLVVTLALMESF